MGSIRDAFLIEFGIAERQLLALAHATPDDKFDWRPHETARSVSEVFVHVAAGNFFLLEVAGQPVPPDIYGQIVASGEERWWTVARHNDELEKTLTDKDAILVFLTRSFFAVKDALNETDQDAFESDRARGIYLRLLAHCHEHMGQLIAYVRVNGLRVPWPDWRPDRRVS